jgi:ABC-type sugar transport system permease subunit
MIEVKVQSLGLDRASNTPVVILQEKGGGRVLPIWIGPGEASAIAMQLADMKFSRPLTHDLLLSVVKGMGQRLASFVKTSIYLPTIVSGVIASIVFILIFDYYGGILNWFLDLLVSPFRDFEPIPWLGDPATALPSLAVPAVWIGFGVTALIMLAGMLDIPDSYYESASLDGATWWQQTIHITIPMLKNVLIYLLIAGCTGAIQQFELPLIMTGGGPLNSTMMPNLYIFQHFTQDQRQGQPLAAALMLFVVLGLVSALIFRFINSEKTQEG